jgi:hypothetical protein
MAMPQDDLHFELAGGQIAVIVSAGVLVVAVSGAPTAFWVGLLHERVGYYERLIGSSLPSGRATPRSAQLAFGDIDQLLGVAEDLARRFGRPDGSEFGGWPTRSIGDLSATRLAVCAEPAGYQGTVE